jgi:DNA-directed RNA polymerase subunit E'/Rpb7
MDPLFERRELIKKVNIHAKNLQKDIRDTLLAQLKVKYQGRCSGEGYIHKNSMSVLSWSIGRPNVLKGGVDYFVTFHADICLPHIGQTFKAPVTLRSKIGVHAEVDPIKVLIPRDLHIGNEDFENVKPDDEIEFEVVGTQFKQGDESVIVVGKMKSRVVPQAEQAVEEQKEVVTPLASSGEEKSVMVVPVANSEKPKRRRLKPTAPSNT